MKFNYMFKEQAVQAYPDGWTCVSCGTEFSEKTIDVDCFYVIDSENGTECLECITNKKEA
jgi:hypothetical protein